MVREIIQENNERKSDKSTVSSSTNYIKLLNLICTRRLKCFCRINEITLLCKDFFYLFAGYGSVCL